MITFQRFLRENAAFLGAGVLLTFTSSFGQTFFISIFAGEIMAHFDLTDGDWGVIYGTGTLASAFVLIWAGGLTDRIRVRYLGLFSMIGLAGACAFLAANPWAGLLPLAVFLLRFTGQGMLTHIAAVAMARWFIATRGRALALSGGGYALGEAILPILFVWALTFADWRVLWVVAGVFCLLLAPLLFRLLKQERTPQSLSADDISTGMAGRHWTRSDMLRHPLFWCMLPSVIGQSAFVTALFFQQVHLSEVKGWSHVGFVALFPVYTASSTLFLLLAGWAIDRFGTARLAPIYQIPIALAFLIMAQADSLFGAALAIGLIGITSGVNATLPSAFWAEFYGTRYVGGIKAIATAAMVLGSAIGPAITGLLIDAGMPFPQQMWMITVWFFGSCAMIGLGLVLVNRSDHRPRLR